MQSMKKDDIRSPLIVGERINVSCMIQDDDTVEAINDWHYWKERGYLFTYFKYLSSIPNNISKSTGLLI